MKIRVGPHYIVTVVDVMTKKRMKVTCEQCTVCCIGVDFVSTGMAGGDLSGR